MAIISSNGNPCFATAPTQQLHLWDATTTRMKRFTFIFLLAMFLFPSQPMNTVDSKSEVVKRILRHVEDVANDKNCTAGTNETLPMQFNLSEWGIAEETAMRMSNYLSRVYIMDWKLTDEQLYQYLASNIDGQTRMYAAWASFEPNVHNNYHQFCPYPAVHNGTIDLHDLGYSYDYVSQNANVIWYEPVRQRSWDNVTISTMFFYEWTKDDNYTSTLIRHQPLIRKTDGIWTAPYYDCGGGNIWMCSFLLPIFNRKNEKFAFAGVVGVDIHVSEIDIDQCDQDSNVTGAVEYFVGSHHCDATTKCHFRPGRGFRRGNYICNCRDGFYLPNQSNGKTYFDGVDIENYFDDRDFSMDTSPFRCSPCAEGCDTCVDDTPCMVIRSWIIRGVVLGAASLLGLFLLGCILFIQLKSDDMAIKSASPLFLSIMCIGGFLMMMKVVIRFFTPSTATCQSAISFELLGFSLLFGALLLKTWRIATLCTIKSAKTLVVTDIVLFHRLLPIPITVAAFLATWTASSPLTTQLFYTKSGKKFYDCAISWWLLLAHSSEVVLLVWGAYLCFRVRKAPSAFNESRYITWAIYNAVLTGNFLLIVMYFFIVQEGPDLVHVMEFIRMVVIVITSVGIILIPKVYVMRQPPRTMAISAMVRKKAFDTISNLTLSAGGFMKTTREVSCQTEDSSVAVSNTAASSSSPATDTEAGGIHVKWDVTNFSRL